MASSYGSSSRSSYSGSSSSYENDNSGEPSRRNLSQYEFTDLTEQETAMVRGRLPPFIRPTLITKVRNPHLWTHYQETKGWYEEDIGSSKTSELSLWHATSASAVESIVTHNFDPRCAERSLYGFGVCFSTDAGYSNFYCNKSVGEKRALILSNVLVGVSTPGYPALQEMPFDHDTAVDKAGLVYIKMEDHEYYPAYVVYYNNRFYQGDKTQHGAVAVDLPKPVIQEYCDICENF